MEMILQALFAFIWIGFVYKLGDWKNWRKYYPTMLFFILGNFIYITIFYNKPLWKFESDYIHFPFSEFYMSFIVFPCTMLLFLPHYPKKIPKQIIYNILWILIYASAEFITFRLGLISYKNRWGIWLSIVHNCYQFPILKLHHEKPLFAWILAFIIIIIFINAFGIPFFV